MKPLRIALALAMLAGVVLAPVAQADRDDRRGYLGRSDGHGIERHAGHRAEPRFKRGHERRHGLKFRRHHGHAIERHRWHGPRHHWYAPRWRATSRYRHHRGYGRHRWHRRTKTYGAAIGFTIDGVTFGLVDHGLR